MERRTTRGKGLTRRDFMRLGAGASVGIIGAGVLASCAPQTLPAPSGGGTDPNATVTFSLGVDLLNLDPHNNVTQSFSLFRHLFDTLVTRDADLNLIPGLAASWRAVNATTWEFKLREGVKFHNGQTFSAADVKFTLDRIIDKNLKLSATTFFASVARTDVVDPTTIRITTVAPDPILPSRLQFNSSILPAATIQKDGLEAFLKSPIGTGPFKFVEWVRDDHLTMEANPDYWRGKPKMAKLTHKPIIEASTRIAALKTGVVDLVSNVQPQQITDVESDSKLQVLGVRSSPTIFIVLNSHKKPFDDVRVRQAMNYGVDVDGIIKNLFQGHAFRVPSMTSPAYFGYDADQKPYTYDPVKAKALLADAGYPNGVDVTLTAPKGRTLLDAEAAQAIAGSLDKIGVRVKVDILDFAVLQSKLFDANNLFQMCYLPTGNPILDIDDSLGTWLDSKRPRGSQYYSDPKLDALIAKGGTTLEVEARKAVYKELLAHVKEQAPWIFLYNLEDLYGVSKRLIWKPTGDQTVYLGGASVAV